MSTRTFAYEGRFSSAGKYFDEVFPAISNDCQLLIRGAVTLIESSNAPKGRLKSNDVPARKPDPYISDSNVAMRSKSCR